MGQLQRIGSSQVRLRLIEDRTGRGSGELFGGIDTTLVSFGARDSLDPAFQSLRRYVAMVNSLRVGTPTLDKLGEVERALSGGFTHSWPYPGLSGQMVHLEKAMAIASGVLIDVITNDDRVTPRQSLDVVIAAWNPSDQAVTVEGAIEATTARWTTPGDGFKFIVPPRGFRADTITVQTASQVPLTQPYFLIQPRDQGIYRLPRDGDSALASLPFDPPELLATLDISDAKGRIGHVVREAGFRLNDQAFGERRRPITIVPRVDVKLDPRNELWSTAPGPHDFTVTLTHGARDSTRGTITLEVPAGWPAVATQKFEFLGEDERETHTFNLRPPANLLPGKYEIRAVATDDKGNRYDQGVFTVDYPHIRPRSWTRSSVASVNVAPLEMARLKRVGYIRGASDRVPEALASVGVPIVMLDPVALERSDLSSFDAIVVGSRAYETDSALVENNARLLAYARNGGLVIVQYQQQVFFNGHFAPFELKVGGEQLVLDSAGGTRVGPLIGHDRVTDETAPVRIIDPRSAVVNRPNRIGPADWDGWVQERGLYFAHSWADAYTPVLEMADPGEAPLRGGLLVAKYGRGTYVYTGISFFRELPAGVPGAFRLFSNLLALGESAVP
jgi:hypothetical protein